MSKARGSKSALRFKPETAAAYGVAPGGNYHGLKFSSETLGGNINEIVSNEISSDRSTPSVRGGNLATGGNVVCDFSLTRLGIFFAHLLGEAPTTAAIASAAVANATAYEIGDVVSSGANDYLCVGAGTTSGAAAADLVGTTLNERLTSNTATFVYFGLDATAKYRHQFRPTNDDLAGGLTFEKAILGGDADKFLQFRGGRISSFGLQIPQEGILQSTFDLLFAGQFTKSDATIAGVPVDLNDEPVTGFESTVLLGGEASGCIREANLTINNNHDGDIYVLGGRTRDDIVPRRREISGSVTAYFENDTELDRFLNEETFALKFAFYHGNAFGSIEFPEVKLFGNPVPQINGPGAITLAFNFRAFKQSAARDVEIILKNLADAYVVQTP